MERKNYQELDINSLRSDRLYGTLSVKIHTDTYSFKTIYDQYTGRMANSIDEKDMKLIPYMKEHIQVYSKATDIDKWKTTGESIPHLI